MPRKKRRVPREPETTVTPSIFRVAVPAGRREKRCRPVWVGVRVPDQVADQTAGRLATGALVKSTVLSVRVATGVPVGWAEA